MSKTAATSTLTTKAPFGDTSGARHYCSTRTSPPRTFAPGVGGERVRAVVVNASK